MKVLGAMDVIRHLLQHELCKLALSLFLESSKCGFDWVHLMLCMGGGGTPKGYSYKTSFFFNGQNLIQ